METNVIETVLTEVLEEMKQINSKLTSFTAILMEIHEWKMKAKDDIPDKLSERLGTVQKTLQALPAKINLPIEEMRQLRDSLESCRRQLKQPIRQVVKYHMSKMLMVAIALFLGCVSMLYFLFDTNSRLELYKAGDIKYRQLQQTNNSTLQRLLFYTDSLYTLNPDSFSINVQLKEAQERLQLKLLERANYKEREAELLRRKTAQIKAQK
jgi:hypothetical protein